ncbi:MAG TPA: EAL domain-containing protein, partial [Chloroflexota bacterium]|nr:EAL domain-containing protein [Chloroflexota bacterium]
MSTSQADARARHNKSSHATVKLTARLLAWPRGLRPGHAVAGAGFGFCFPLAAWAFDLLFRQAGLSLAGLWAIHQANPMHWIIDSAPVVLGVMGSLIGRKQAQLATSESRHRDLVENSEALIFTHDLSGMFLSANSAAGRVLGYPAEELIGRSLAEFLAAETPNQFAFYLTQCRQNEVASGSLRVLTRDGQERIWAYANSVHESRGEPNYVRGHAQDITDRVRAQEALQRAEEQLRSVLVHAPVAIFALDRIGCISLWEGRGLDALGASDAAVGRSIFEVCANAPQLREQVCRALAGEEVVTVMELAGRVFDTRYQPLRDASDQVIRVIGIATDITERKRVEDQLTELAFHDLLTSLPNRALLMERLDEQMARARRSHRLVAVLFLDLDNFKFVNDSLGHERGDELLIAVGERLQACVRPEDTVARMGGDEFTILLSHVSDVSDAVRTAQRIAERLETAFVLNGHEVYASASIGIALNSAEHLAPEDLLRDADVAMYWAKSSGKSRHEVFDRRMRTRAVERLELETDLRHALERQEFRVYYQPIVRLQTGELVGVEALVRWEHPRRGLVAPADFIPLAEETGIIVPLGKWVLETACAQVRAWQHEFSENLPLTLSVNLSARQLQDRDLVEGTVHTLWQCGLDPANLVLEITESVMMQDAEASIRTLRELKSLGIRLAVDDFGTGYSSLAYLNRLPIDILKIDKSFV